MIPYWSNGRAVLWQGHVLDCLAAMEAGSVHCGITSSPYWGLRSYPGSPVEWPAVSYAPMAGLPPLDIPGCDPECAHVWGEEQVVKAGRNDAGERQDTFHTSESGYGGKRDASQGQYCQLCGGWRGSLGLEPDPAMFVGHIVLVARELWRVLRDDGTFWLNFGDSYFGDSPTRKRSKEAFSKEWDKSQTASRGGLRRSASQQNGLKPKNLIGIPWRVAFALQADGWWLRSDIIWAKGVSFCPTYSGSCMPESVRDRPTTGHEHVFLLTKNKRYFYDGDAVKERSIHEGRIAGTTAAHTNDITGGHCKDGLVALGKRPVAPTRNLRTVWTINPGNFPGSHFATFPTKLVEPMIKAGTSQRGCCPKCLSPWVRVTEHHRRTITDKFDPKHLQGETSGLTGPGWRKLETPNAHSTTTGWTPTCSCGTEHPIPQEELDADPTLLDDFEIEPFEPVPCTVLDPFAGTFTTGEVAIRLGRAAVGIELSKSYCDDHIIPRLSKGIQMEMGL